MDQCHRHIRLSLIDLAAFVQTAHSFLPLHLRRSFSRLDLLASTGKEATWAPRILHSQYISRMPTQIRVACAFQRSS
ncbi:hypothetical protein K1719_017813 [Acacia pycnantha]|nr:hypothetical protein K1719_017813 [Acacia pycnantha]